MNLQTKYDCYDILTANLACIFTFKEFKLGKWIRHTAPGLLDIQRIMIIKDKRRMEDISDHFPLQVNEKKLLRIRPVS